MPVDDLTLRVPARSRLLVDARLLPIGAARVAGSDYDFTEGRRLGGTVLDTAFGDVDADGDGRSRVEVSAPDGRSVTVWADSSFGWWQVYSSDTLPADRLREDPAANVRGGAALLAVPPRAPGESAPALRC